MFSTKFWEQRPKFEDPKGKLTLDSQEKTTPTRLCGLVLRFAG